jgi:hypothetical protein
MAAGIETKAYCVDLEKISCHMIVEINNYWLMRTAAEARNTQFSIFRVPEHIREVDKNAYEPIILAIGPYHHGSQTLVAMETEKWKCLNFILNLNCNRSLQDYIRVIAEVEKDAKNSYSEDMELGRKKFLQMLLLDACFILVKADGTVTTLTPQHVPSNKNAMQGITGEAAAEEIQVVVNETKNEASYIADRSTEHRCSFPSILHNVEEVNIERDQLKDKNDLMLCDKDNNISCLNDYNTTGDWYSNSSWHDLFLLENQIPLFVVERLYNYIMDKVDVKPLFTARISECIEDVMRQYPKAIHESGRPKQFCHLLHLCQTYLRPSKKDEGCCDYQAEPRNFYRLLHSIENYFGLGNNKSLQNSQNMHEMQQMDCFQDGQLPSRWRRATQYHEAGVSLKKREYHEYDRHSLLDVKFRDGAVEVPCFPIDENTESLFKNLVAFEQTDPQFGNDITAYIVFMSQFVTTPDDVTLLTERGIIMHMLDSDEEVSALFTRLTKQVFFDSYDDYYLKSLCHMLEAHYQSRLNRWIALLWRNHFSNPWLTLGMLAAIIVLVCTLIQTIYTVLAYENPQH